MEEKVDKSKPNDGDESTSWLTEWEKQLIADWERNVDAEDVFRHESETSTQMWSSFQHAATTISHLFKGDY